MPDLLLELFSEEIPARMQRQARADLERLTTDALLANGLTFEGAAAFATPRRLAIHVAGVPARQADRREERRGPRVGAPESAIAGFLKAAGLKSLEEAVISPDPKGREGFYVAVLEKRGADSIDVLREILPPLIRAFPWPKSMRWGAASARGDSLRWVRPLHAIAATFGPETEEPEIIRFDVDGLASGETTYGHRFMRPEPIRVRRFADYVQSLAKAKVILDPARRQDIIRSDARNLALAQGLELVEDEALIEETAGLVEWPVVLLGAFSADFLSLPPEVVRATIRANQKCFVLRRSDGALADKFLLVANIEASDGGRAIVAGNERVVRARLSDARFFWDADRELPLDARLPKLDSMIFHERLGTQGERRRRLEALARSLAQKVGADPDLAVRAARLAKADLVTEMVGEFPELQGVMGRRYALAERQDPRVAQAIEDHYRPAGPSDRVPADPVSIAVALADKVDALVGFWSIDETPTGSKDPFALRRAALGVIRIALENGVRLRLGADVIDKDPRAALFAASDPDGRRRRDSLLGFFVERLKVHLRDKGARHDLIDAAIAARQSGSDDAAPDDLLLIVRRVEALERLLATDDGKSLLAGFKRAVNIVRIEERKDGSGAFDGRHRPDLCRAAEEKQLAEAIAIAADRAAKLIDKEDFEAAMRALGELRNPVDAFFDRVTVNDADPAQRANRLRLLNELRTAMLAAADFAKIAG